jgi:hypothetical protein
MDGATTLGAGTLSSWTATYSTSALAAGGHTITAEYGGDLNFDTSTSSELMQEVEKKFPWWTILPAVMKAVHDKQQQP